MKDKGPIVYIEEPYTCTVCGRQNLKFQEIGWKPDKDDQIDLSTVTCQSCALISVWPYLKKCTSSSRRKKDNHQQPSKILCHQRVENPSF